jgi:phenylalanyl-tRNA synthetase alpha chain
MEQIQQIRNELLAELQTLENPNDILKSPKIKELYKIIPTLPNEQKGAFGAQVNDLKNEIQAEAAKIMEAKESAEVEALDISAPFAESSPEKIAAKPELLSAKNGSIHPLQKELERVVDIYTRMGFEAVESRQIDDDWNMFGALNFPENHPARDGYDTFRTEEGFIPPAHTSTMQNRVLKHGKKQLEEEGQIAHVSYGRVFRNEDLDATHEHTFYQCEGVFVSENATLAQMLGTLHAFFEEYYGQKLKIKTQPGYFPFTEPSLEFLIEKPAVLGGKPGEWLEMLGCGMIHPNVLEAAGIDSKKYRGFAWGGGIERLVMLKYGISDIRYFESGKLEFLREF